MSDKIADTPLFKDLNNKIKVLNDLSYFMPDLLTEEQKQEARDMEEKICNLRTLPDRFNNLYLKLGWVCYESMNLDLVKRCIALGENGHLEDGEKELKTYYQGDIRHLILPLRSIPGFKERYNLLQKALDDFSHERYHACVPIFLMIIDGAVNQVLKENQGLFAQNVDLTLYDSIIGHPTGLASLIQLMSRTRKKTTTSSINIPYRNGILHCMDIGYDNDFVAAKALATLLAVAQWIKHFCDEKHKEPHKKEPQNIIEIYKELKSYNEKTKELESEKKAIKQWKPRNFSHTDFTNYVPREETPEYRLFQFLNLYQSENYGKMAEILTDFSGRTVGFIAGNLRSWLNGKKCIDYRILDIKDISPAISEILLSINIAVNDEIKRIKITARLLYLTNRIKCEALTRGNPGGTWYIHNRIIQDIFNQTCL